ncbi:MAG: type II toxin-antitoxin system VapC family toxin [Anaerolineales bacterium]
MTENYLLDAWAMLAYLENENPANLRVTALLKDARQGNVLLFMSIINLGEVYYRAGKKRGEEIAEQILAGIRLLPVEILPADDNLVLEAARWKMRHPISYADAFAIVSAQKTKATLVTGDPELVALQEILPIEPLKRS